MIKKVPGVRLTAKPVGSACIGEHHNATNVSRIITTLWPIHKSLQNCFTSIHGFRYIATSIHNNILINKLIIIYSLLCFFLIFWICCIELTMSRCNDVSMNRCRDVTMSRYNDALMSRCDEKCRGKCIDLCHAFL